MVGAASAHAPATGSAASQAGAPGLGGRLRTPEYWQWVRFVAFGRALPAVLFGFMGWLQLSRLAAAAASLPAGTGVPGGAQRLLPSLLYALFCAIPVGIYLTRPPARRRDGRPVARAAALVGTTMQLVVGAFLPAGPLLLDPPQAVAALSVALTVIAFGIALWGLLCLRRNLSIIPEARRLVTSGPYRLVRHPLYCGEVLAAAALVLSHPALVPAAALAVFVSLQLLRARFEERLLASTFDEYAGYAARTRRLVPFVW